MRGYGLSIWVDHEFGPDPPPLVFGGAIGLDDGDQY